MATYDPDIFNPVTPGSYSTGSSGYNVNPAPRGGALGEVGAAFYGSKPGVTGNPDPYKTMTDIAPWLPQANALAGQDITRQLSGDVDTDYLRNLAANLGITTGIGAGGPTKSGFVDNSMLINGMLYRDYLQNQGLSNYGKIIPTISGTQTLSPALQLENAWWNATNSAAPDPGLAGLKSDTENIIGMFAGMI